MRNERILALSLLLSVIVAAAGESQYHREQKEVVATQGVVASCDDRATEVGLEVLKNGGNAIDAAVTIAFLMAVYEPYNSGIGGHGGHMALYWAKTGEYLAIDASTRAPAAAKADMFEVLGQPADHAGDVWRVDVEDDANRVGFRAMFAPSTVAGYWHLVQNYGTMSWKEVIAPAIKVAEEGFFADELYVNSVKRNANLLERFPGSADMYMPGGKLPAVGDRIVFKDLANTLKRLAEGGRDIFYQGEIADEIVRYVQEGGGILTNEDFTSYEVEVSSLVATPYRGDIVLSYPQSSNGATIAEALNILSNFDLRRMGYDSADFIHTFIESLNLAFADRYAYAADRDQVPVPYDGMMSWVYGREQAKRIDMNKAQLYEAGDPWRYEASGYRLYQDSGKASGVNPPTPPPSFKANGEEDTTFLCAADRDGNLLLLTTSLQSAFGSKVTVPGLGITLNSSMYNSNPVPGHPLSIAPFKRTLRNSGPVIVVRDHKPYLIVSAPGGRPIISALIRTLTNVLDYRMGIQAAIDAPRIHSEGNLYEVEVESRIPAVVLEQLSRRGHRMVVKDPYSGGFALVQGIMVDPESGLLFAGSDPRTHGGARGY